MRHTNQSVQGPVEHDEALDGEVKTNTPLYPNVRVPDYIEVTKNRHTGEEMKKDTSSTGRMNGDQNNVQLLKEQFKLITTTADEENVHNHDNSSAKIDIEQDCTHLLHNIVVRGCMIAGHGIKRDEETNAIIKVLYLQPRADNANTNTNTNTYSTTTRSHNVLHYCRKVIHECSMGDIHIGQYQSSFLWNINDKAIEQKILQHGHVGDLLFCVYNIDPRTKQRIFFGQCIVPLRQYGCRINDVYPLYLRDDQTLLDVDIKIETEVFLPEVIKERLWRSTSSEGQGDDDISPNRDEANSYMYNLPPTTSSRKSTGSNRNRNMDVCVEVFERRKRDSQRRSEREKYRLLQMNEKLQKRLRSISMKKRETFTRF